MNMIRLTFDRLEKATDDEDCVFVFLHIRVDPPLKLSPTL